MRERKGFRNKPQDWVGQRTHTYMLDTWHRLIHTGENKHTQRLARLL